MRKNLRWMIILVLLLGLTSLACSLAGSGDPTPAPEPTPTNTPQPAPADTSPLEEPADEPQPTAVPSPTPVPAPAEDSNNDNGNEAAANTNENDSSGNENGSASNENSSSGDTSGNDTSAEPPPITLDPFAATTNLDFDSYTIKFLVDFEGKDPAGDTVTQLVSASMNFIVDPPAMSMSFTAEGIEDAEEFGNLSLAQIEDTSYMVLPGLGCITSSTAEMNLIEDNPFEDIFSSQDIIDDLEGAEYAGNETINGIETDHYILDKDDLDLDADQEVESAEGHLYLAKDGGYLVKLVMEGVGEFDMFEDSGAVGEFYVELNLTNINAVAEIVPPEECADAAGGSEYPVLDDATEYNSFAGLVSYKSGYSVKDAVAFYDAELAADDWTKLEDEAFVT